MLKKLELPSVLVSAILFVLLFYKHPIGLNLLLFEIILFVWLLITKAYVFRTPNGLLAGIGLIISALATVFIFSTLALFVNVFAIFVFIGVLTYPHIKSLINAFGLGFINFFTGSGEFINTFIQLNIMGKKSDRFIWKYRIYIIPIFIILVFLMMYSASNPIFNRVTTTITEFISKHLHFFIQNLNYSLLLTIILGLVIGSFVFFRKANKTIVDIDQQSKDEMERLPNKVNQHFKTLALKNEYKAGLFLLIIL